MGPLLIGLAVAQIGYDLTQDNMRDVFPALDGKHLGVLPAGGFFLENGGRVGVADMHGGNPAGQF